MQHNQYTGLYMPSTRQIIITDTWTEALGAGALGVITVQRGTILVNRSVSMPLDDTGQLIGDTSLDKIYEREADSDDTLKLWVRAVGSSGKAEIVIDEGLNVSGTYGSGGSAAIDVSTLATSAKQDDLITKADATIDAIEATNGMAIGDENKFIWDAITGSLKVKKYFKNNIFDYEVRYTWDAITGKLINKKRFEVESI